MKKGALTVAPQKEEEITLTMKTVAENTEPRKINIHHHLWMPVVKGSGLKRCRCGKVKYER